MGRRDSNDSSSSSSPTSELRLPMRRHPATFLNKRKVQFSRWQLACLVLAIFSLGMLFHVLFQWAFSSPTLPTKPCMQSDGDLRTALVENSEDIPKLQTRNRQIDSQYSLHDKVIFLHGEGIWTKYDLWSKEGWKKCPTKYQNCRVTKDVHDNHRPDAIVYNAEAMPDQNEVKSLKEKRNGMKVFLSGIIPLNSRFQVSNFDDFFDVTITYKADSTIRIPYWPNDGKLPAMYRVKTPGKLLSQDDILDLEEEKQSYFQRHGKEEYMAFTAKNCSAMVFANMYVNKLRDEGAINIYAGDTEKCSATLQNVLSLPCSGGLYSDACVKHFEQFKFVVAPDSDLCEDYISRDYWYAVLAWHAVPVMYGAANFSKYLIPGSYIDALEEEYISPTFKKAYAVSSNSLAYYKKFHWWRHEDRVESYYWQCELCKYLNDQPVPAQNANKVKMTSFWNAEKDCGKSTKAFELMRAQFVRTGVIRG